MLLLLHSHEVPSVIKQRLIKVDLYRQRIAVCVSITRHEGIKFFPKQESVKSRRRLGCTEGRTHDGRPEFESPFRIKCHWFGCVVILEVQWVLKCARELKGVIFTNSEWYGNKTGKKQQLCIVLTEESLFEVVQSRKRLTGTWLGVFLRQQN